MFERIQFKMCQPRELKHNADHFHDRTFERDAPVEKFRLFEPHSWRLVTAEVRTDTGKFVTTSWEVDVDGTTWWVVIGLHDTIQTVYPTNNKTGLNDGIVTNGDLYQFVDTVNRNLMEAER